MKTLTRGTCAAVAALALAGTGIWAPVEAGTPSSQAVRIALLHRSGHPAGIAWLDGRVLHTPKGDTSRLPWTAKAAEGRSLRVLGHTPRGWLVKDHANSSWNVWLVHGQRRTKLSSTGVSEGDLVTVVPSTDHHRYAVTDFDGDASALVMIYNAHGHKVASRTFDGDGAVLDFSGPEAVIGTSDTQRWLVNDPDHPGEGSVTDLGVDGAGASLTHDLLLVRDPGTDEVGPTSLSDPGAPAWTAPMQDPRISPDGASVVSEPEPHSQYLDVRAMSSGDLIRRFEISYPAPGAPVWATSTAFAFIGATTGLGDRERLARCTVGGHCRAQSAARPSDRISIPPL